MIVPDFDHALEAAVSAIEHDLALIPTMHGQLLDLRAMCHIESVETLRQLIRSGGFGILLNRGRDDARRVFYSTVFGRVVRCAPVTGHRMIESIKGWLVLDCPVELYFDALTWLPSE